ncbi:hypothetical protein D3C72_798070 [compost metagenome]
MIDREAALNTTLRVAPSATSPVMRLLTSRLRVQRAPRPPATSNSELIEEVCPLVVLVRVVSCDA